MTINTSGRRIVDVRTDVQFHRASRPLFLSPRHIDLSERLGIKRRELAGYCNLEARSVALAWGSYANPPNPSLVLLRYVLRERQRRLS